MDGRYVGEAEDVTFKVEPSAVPAGYKQRTPSTYPKDTKPATEEECEMDCAKVEGWNTSKCCAICHDPMVVIARIESGRARMSYLGGPTVEVCCGVQQWVEDLERKICAANLLETSRPATAASPATKTQSNTESKPAKDTL